MRSSHAGLAVPRACSLGLATAAAAWVGTCASFRDDLDTIFIVAVTAATVFAAQLCTLAFAGIRLERSLLACAGQGHPASDHFVGFASRAMVITLATALLVGPLTFIAAAGARQVEPETLLLRCLAPFGGVQLLFGFATFISVRGSLRRRALDLNMSAVRSPSSTLVRVLVGLTFTVPIPLAVLLVISAAHSLYFEAARDLAQSRLSRTARAVLAFEDATPQVSGPSALTAFDSYRPIVRTDPLSDGTLSAWPSPSSPVGLEIDDVHGALPWPVTLGLTLTALLLATVIATRVFSMMTRARRQLTAKLDALPERLLRTPFESPFHELTYFDELLDRLKQRFDEMRQRQRRSIETGRKDRELKAQFFAGMSHDLRSPLNSIIGFTDLLLGGIEGELTLEQKRAVLSVSAESERLMSLIADILDTSKLDAGRFDLERAWVPPVEIVSGCTAEARRTLGERAIEITPAVQAGLPPVFVDKSRIQQALIGLLTRATQSATRGAFRIKAWSERAVSGTQMLRIDIIDVSVSLSETERLLIAEALSSAASIPSRSSTGALGLGIALARDIVHLHGGDLVVHRGGATVFSVVLPLDEPKS